MNTLQKTLSATTYPGRGILVGLSSDGKYCVAAYFIMGRSENSRNRVFVPDGDGIRTKAFDEAKMSDPSLVIYAPVRVHGKTIIITNGDQTDTIYEGLKNGIASIESLCGRSFEPDAPNYTPRISAVINVDKGELSYQLSILKSANGNPDSCYRFFYQYNEPEAGVAHFIHTYKCDGDPIPSFEGEPDLVELRGDIDAITSAIWDNLNQDNKVSLFVRTIELTSGKAETRIVNKHQED